MKMKDEFARIDAIHERQAEACPFVMVIEINAQSTRDDGLGNFRTHRGGSIRFRGKWDECRAWIAEHTESYRVD